MSIWTTRNIAWDLHKKEHSFNTKWNPLNKGIIQNIIET